MKKKLAVILSLALLSTAIYNMLVLASVNVGGIKSNHTGTMKNIEFKKDKKQVNIRTNFDYDSATQYVKSVTEEEMNESTGVLDSELERALNYAGILDSEIENFTVEDIENIENANEVMISVKCGYIDDETGECVLINAEECGEEYFEQEKLSSDVIHEKWVETKQSKNIVENVLGTVGILPQTVYGAYTDTSMEQTKGGKFRQILYLTASKSINGSKAAYFKYVAQWLETPVYCYDDYFTLATSGIPIKPGKVNGLEYACEYTETCNVIYGGKNSKQVYRTPKKEEMNLSKFDYKSDSEHALIFMHQELPGGKNGQKVENVQVYPELIDYQYVYSNIRMTMKGYLLRKNSAQNQFVVNANYFHLKANKPKVKIQGVSLGLPTSVSITFSGKGSKNDYSNLVGNTNVEIDVDMSK